MLPLDFLQLCKCFGVITKQGMLPTTYAIGRTIYGKGITIYDIKGITISKEYERYAHIASNSL